MALSAAELVLDRSSDVPLGTQLAWKLRGAIVAERLSPHERLPGVRELAASAGVNVNTVRAVYARLVQQGLILSERGRGTFVSELGAEHGELRELAEQAAHDARLRGVDPRELAAVLYAGAREKSVADDPVVRRSLRAQIAALEQELAALQSELPADEILVERPTAAGARGPRILTAVELDHVRQGLAAAVADLRERVARTHTPKQRPLRGPSPKADSEAAWPELFASRARLSSG